MYGIYCVTSDIDPMLVYWSVNGVEMNNTDYTLVDESNQTYNSTLLLNNTEPGQSVTVTCSVEGIRNDTVTLEG